MINKQEIKNRAQAQLDKIREDDIEERVSIEREVFNQ